MKEAPEWLRDSLSCIRSPLAASYGHPETAVRFSRNLNEAWILLLRIHTDVEVDEVHFDGHAYNFTTGSTRWTKVNTGDWVYDLSELPEPERYMMLNAAIAVYFRGRFGTTHIMVR